MLLLICSMERTLFESTTEVRWTTFKLIGTWEIPTSDGTVPVTGKFIYSGCKYSSITNLQQFNIHIKTNSILTKEKHSQNSGAHQHQFLYAQIHEINHYDMTQNT